MDANELADAMEIRASIRRKATSRKSVQEGANDRLADQLEQAATMLRQQQAEIEASKEKLIMEEESYILLDEECLFAKEAIKLHQAEIEALKAKTLTDEEIEEVYKTYFDMKTVDKYAILFARAILRKAQEK